MIDSPIGDLKEVDPKDVQEGQKLVILRAVEGMVFLFYSGDGWGEISGDHYFLVGDKPEIPDAATVEQSQVEALGSLIWHTSRDDESTISATGATIIAKAILAKFNVTEPDASITDLIAEAGRWPNGVDATPSASPVDLIRRLKDALEVSEKKRAAGSAAAAFRESKPESDTSITDEMVDSAADAIQQRAAWPSLHWPNLDALQHRDVANAIARAALESVTVPTESEHKYVPVTGDELLYTDLIAEARKAVARINPGAHDPDALFQYRGGVFGREVTLMLRELADALESVTVPTENELLERAKADATNDAFVDAVAWARSCSGESADAAADYIQEMSTRGSEN